MTSNTDPKFAIVVGGSAGVGRATVDALLARGHTVGVIARGQDRLDELVTFPNVSTACADAGDADALSVAVESLIAQHGVPDIWVNCAMATSFSPFKDMAVDEFDQIVRTTFLGQVNGTRLALKHMTSGNIVHVGSGLSYRPVPFQSAYCAAKHAINGFVGAVRSEVLRDDRAIELSLVQLPAINTPQFDWARNRLSKKPQPAPPIFTPDVAARAVMQSIDKNKREVLVGGSVLKLLFGDLILPAFIDRKLARDGVEMQKSDRPEPGGRQDNLFDPVSMVSTANGSFGEEASDKAVIVDADLARKAFFFGGLALAFVLGLIIG